MGRASRWLKKLLGGKEDSSREAKQNGFTGELRMEKKRWSFKSESRLPAASSWFSQNEENKHAIAVAEATAATADAAVAAAQAAVGVVCLTSNGRGNASTAAATAGERQWLAAVKIQSLFRAYLAKKALRALKALVKLQALVKGYLVRKQAAATLRSIQALIRAQAIVRAQKSHVIPEVRQRVHLERFEESRRERVASFRRRRLSVNLNCMNNGYYDRSPKIVEVDAYCRLKSRSSRSTLMDTTEEDMTLNSFSSMLPCQMPAKISTPQSRSFQDCDWSLTNDKYLYSSTAQTTPRYVNSTSNCTVPAKSVSAADGVFRGPSYMAKTRSFEAKVRSQSAPKQRPEPAGLRKMLPLSGELIDP